MICARAWICVDGSSAPAFETGISTHHPVCVCTHHAVCDVSFAVWQVSLEDYQLATTLCNGTFYPSPNQQ